MVKKRQSPDQNWQNSTLKGALNADYDNTHVMFLHQMVMSSKKMSGHGWPFCVGHSLINMHYHSHKEFVRRIFIWKLLKLYTF